MPYEKNKKEVYGEIEESIDWQNFLIEIDDNFNNKVRKYYANKPGQIKKLKQSLAIFLIDPFNARLNHHKLTRKKYRSISFGGDHRMLFYFKDKQTAVFHDVGTHGTLY